MITDTKNKLKIKSKMQNKVKAVNVHKIDLILRHGPALEAPRAGHRFYVTGSIHGWSRSLLTHIPGGCQLAERKLTSRSPAITVKFSVQYKLKFI